MTDLIRREEFEAWRKSDGNYDFEPREDSVAWLAWQAAYLAGRKARVDEAEDRIVDLGNRCLKAEAALAALLAAEVATGPSEEEVAEAIQREVIEQMPDLNEPIAKAAARVAMAMLRGKP